MRKKSTGEAGGFEALAAQAREMAQDSDALAARLEKEAQALAEASFAALREAVKDPVALRELRKGWMEAAKATGSDEPRPGADWMADPAGGGTALASLAWESAEGALRDPWSGMRVRRSSAEAAKGDVQVKEALRGRSFSWSSHVDFAGLAGFGRKEKALWLERLSAPAVAKWAGSLGAKAQEKGWLGKESGLVSPGLEELVRADLASAGLPPTMDFGPLGSCRTTAAAKWDCALGHLFMPFLCGWRDGGRELPVTLRARPDDDLGCALSEWFGFDRPQALAFLRLAQRWWREALLPKVKASSVREGSSQRIDLSWALPGSERVWQTGSPYALRKGMDERAGSARCKALAGLLDRHAEAFGLARQEPAPERAAPGAEASREARSMARLSASARKAMEGAGGDVRAALPAFKAELEAGIEAQGDLPELRWLPVPDGAARAFLALAARGSEKVAVAWREAGRWEDLLSEIKEARGEWGREAPGVSEAAASLLWARLVATREAGKESWVCPESFGRDALEACCRWDSEKGRSERARLLENLWKGKLWRGDLDRSKPTAEGLERLRSRWPHFEEALDALRAGLMSGAKTLPPVLLAGPPGVGKSSFCAAFAKETGAPFRRADLGAMSLGMALTGSDPTWSGAKPGLFYQAICEGEHLTPVFLLDEIDKAAGHKEHSVFSALLSALEPSTAAFVQDEFGPTPMNLRRAMWIASANELSAIPGPILSRFLVVEVDEPKGEQKLAVAQSVLEDLRADGAWPAPLEAGALEKVAEGSPREMRRMLLRAMARSRERSLADPEAPERILASDVPDAGSSKSALGFLNV